MTRKIVLPKHSFSGTFIYLRCELDAGQRKKCIKCTDPSDSQASANWFQVLEVCHYTVLNGKVKYWCIPAKYKCISVMNTVFPVQAIIGSEALKKKLFTAQPFT